ncbi:MAG: hypothetical protein ACYDBQ_04730 [Thermoplasmatota archaeon]
MLVFAGGELVGGGVELVDGGVAEFAVPEGPLGVEEPDGGGVPEVVEVLVHPASRSMPITHAIQEKRVAIDARTIRAR